MYLSLGTMLNIMFVEYIAIRLPSGIYGRKGIPDYERIPDHRMEIFVL